MAQVIADRRDVDFVLFEQLDVERLSKHERYAEFNRKTVELILSRSGIWRSRSCCPPRKMAIRRAAVSRTVRSSCPKAFIGLEAISGG